MDIQLLDINSPNISRESSAMTSTMELRHLVVVS